MAKRLEGRAAVVTGARRGRIIAISSTSGVYGNSGQANYGAAKDGIAGLTRVAARDVGRYGITVNAVCPGAMTRMTATVPQTARAVRAERGLSTGAGERRFPLRNFGPENVAPWVVYLATDAAKNVNGQLFLVMAIAITVPERSLKTSALMTATGRWPACSRPTTGLRSAQRTSPLRTRAIRPDPPPPPRPRASARAFGRAWRTRARGVPAR